MKVLKTLINKGILEEYFIQKDRIEYTGEEDSEIKKLNEDQERAFRDIKTIFEIDTNHYFLPPEGRLQCQEPCFLMHKEHLKSIKNDLFPLRDESEAKNLIFLQNIYIIIIKFH